MAKIAKDSDRIQSFSIRPTDTPALVELQNLRDYAKTTGICFSFLVIKAITMLNKELQVNGK